MNSKLLRVLTLTALATGITCSGVAQQTAASGQAPGVLTASAEPPAGADANLSHAPTAASTQPKKNISEQINDLQRRIDELQQQVSEAKAEAAADNDANALKTAESNMLGGSAATSTTAQMKPVNMHPMMADVPAGVPQSAPAAAPAAPAPPDPHAPAFSDWDWTWLNGNPRNKDVAFDSKFFTPEIRSDVTYNYDFNRPVDNTMSGSSELFRANEIQLEQLGIGGDFHLDNAHARFMTQFGMYSTATVRNDPSYSKGQWDIADADRFLSEAYGGYQIPNVMHGLNFDAGIFMSYIGLFSYYNFDNWAYQPSFVSSNTPWFFQGIRVQMFPTQHLKIEPWFIDGWQSYGTSNARKGLGGQIKWTPYSWMNIVSNNYGLGHDDLGVAGRSRIHTDNSIEIKYYDRPAKDKGIDKMAFSFTGDMGCEYGAGVNCHNDKNGNVKQSMIGYMIYNRIWTNRDKYGFTIGGGQLNNPGMYLVLIPPINGMSASSSSINSPYFPQNPGDPFTAWDGTVTFDYMPREWATWRWEYGYRHASIPYWAGRGGVTPPAYLGASYGSNNGNPTEFACMDGSAVPAAPGQAGQVPAGTTGTGAPTYAINYCNSTSISGTPHGGIWYPDLRRDEQYVDIDFMVKF